MDLDNYKFRYDAYKNNTFNLDVMEQSLEESKITAYQYLRNFQLESTGYKRFDFGMKDIYKSSNINHNPVLIPRRWLFFLEHEFINVGKRLDYRRSEFYEKDISYNEVISRPDLFDSTFLVFINGKLYTKGIKVLCKEDKTYLIFYCNESPMNEGFSINEMFQYIESNANVTIFIIPNTGIKAINTNAYRIRTLNNSTGIPNRLLDLSENIDYNCSLSYINNNDNSSSIPVNTNLTDSGLYVDNKLINELIKTNPDNTAMSIQLIPLRNLLMKINIPKGEEWFKIPLQDYPVAVENCLIFDEDGMFAHNVRITHHYPNIYHVENIDEYLSKKNLSVYVFYYNNLYNKLKHINQLEVYHKYMPNLLEKYADGTINTFVRDFEPGIVDYTIKDFNISDYFNDHFKYKIAKMKEFISIDPNNFRRYLRNLGLGNNYYYVDISKIDLNTRRRTDNRDTKMRLCTFDEDMYMFVFRNDFRGMYDKLLIHVDGIRYDDVKIFETDMLDYLYIPCRLIKQKSILEIEKISEVMREYEFISNNSDDIVTIDIGERAIRNKTLYNDLFLIDKETKEVIPPESYQIILPIKLNIEDKEGNIVLDYLISESDKSYYQLKGIEYGYAQLIKQNYYEVEENSIKNKLRVRDEVTSKVYQLDVKNHDVDLKELRSSSHIIDYIKSNENMDINYQFKVVDGKVKIKIVPMNDSDARGTIAYGGLDILDLGEVFLPCHRNIKLKITDETYLGRDIILAIKKNYKYDKLSFPLDKQIHYLRSENGSIYRLTVSDDILTTYEVDQYKNVNDAIYLNDSITGNMYKLYMCDDVLCSEPSSDLDATVTENLIVYDDRISRYEIYIINGKVVTKQLYSNSSYSFISYTKPNDGYFRLYRNGHLVPRHSFTINTKTTDDKYFISNVTLLFDTYPTDELYIETMPYIMKQVGYLESIPRDEVIDLSGMIDKPFDLKWYELYINGRKMTKHDIEIISANKIKLIKTNSLQWLEIIENSRDKEYFGYTPIYDVIDILFDNDNEFASNINKSIIVDDMKDIEEPVINGVITELDSLLNKLYNHLINNFGLINPDILQISRSLINEYPDFINLINPFSLNPDSIGKLNCGRVLFVNPDE